MGNTVKEPIRLGEEEEDRVFVLRDEALFDVPGVAFEGDDDVTD